jgi:hypothetical protein
MYPPVSVQGTATKDIPNCSSVTYLPTAVTESCIDARQLFCEKASNINGLRDFLIFFRIFGAWAGWRS